MDYLRKVQSGQKLEIPAATFNSFVDAARDFKDRQRDKRSTPEPYFPDSGIILVSNQSSEDRNRFDVLGVVAHKCRFVILLEPVKANKIAHAVIAGVTVVRLRIDDPLDTCCDVEPGVCDYRQLFEQAGVNALALHVPNVFLVRGCHSAKLAELATRWTEQLYETKTHVLGRPL